MKSFLPFLALAVAGGLLVLWLRLFAVQDRVVAASVRLEICLNRANPSCLDDYVEKNSLEGPGLSKGALGKLWANEIRPFYGRVSFVYARGTNFEEERVFLIPAQSPNAIPLQLTIGVDASRERIVVNELPNHLVFVAVYARLCKMPPGQLTSKTLRTRAKEVLAQIASEYGITGPVSDYDRVKQNWQDVEINLDSHSFSAPWPPLGSAHKDQALYEAFLMND